MKKELDDQLCKDFPLLYRDRNGSSSYTCLCWGFTFEDGWYSLVRELSERLEPLIQKYIDENPDLPCVWCNQEKYKHPVGCHNPDNGKYVGNYPTCAQAKEKFSQLRFYMTVYTDEINELIREAEVKSSKICEECGEPGSYRSGSWVRTLCDTHAVIDD